MIIFFKQERQRRYTQLSGPDKATLILVQFRTHSNTLVKESVHVIIVITCYYSNCMYLQYRVLVLLLYQYNNSYN